MEINLINAFIWLKSLGKKTDEIDAKIASGVKSVAGRTGDVVLAKTDVGLSSVDNTTDAGKPISTATQTALDGKEPTLTISSLTAMTTWADTDLVLVDNGGTKKKMTVAYLKSLMGAYIIESGSNANGSYTKWSNGTLECWHNVACVATANTYASFDWTYPIANQAGVLVVASAQINVLTVTWDCTVYILGIELTNDTLARIKLKTNTTQTYYIGVRMIGRWKA